MVPSSDYLIWHDMLIKFDNFNFHNLQLFLMLSSMLASIAAYLARTICLSQALIKLDGSIYNACRKKSTKVLAESLRCLPVYLRNQGIHTKSPIAHVTRCE